MFMPPARNRTPELMDDPGLPRDEHTRALAGLSRINRLSGASSPLWRKIRTVAKGDPRKPLTVIDVASGSADLPRALCARAASEHIALSVTATDISEQALAIAASQSDDGRVSFLRHDVLDQPLPKSADIVTCSLFLHHLDPPQVVLVLRRLMDATDRLLLVHDLRRTRRGLALAWLVPRLLTTSRVVHVDAVRSVHGAYTPVELADMADAAGLKGTRIQCTFPQRMLLMWERPK